MAAGAWVACLVPALMSAALCWVMAKGWEQ